jgi:serine/threonine protein kinase
MDRLPPSSPGDTSRDPAQPGSDPPGHTSDLPTLGRGAASTTAGFLGPNDPSLAVLGQRYDILGEAGRGAMGQVYKARDRETGEIVALKLLKPEIASDQAMVDRFKRELLFARKITHKNVCRVYEFNRIDGIAYTSMEFVEGENLRSVLNRFGSLTQRKGLDLALQMCSGLKEAHAQGIVHRDLKPENVMIDGQGNLKIMDFGIARSMERMTLLTGAMTGTPAYMAPEQATGKTVDYRTDIYAFGLMLYEIFTGEQAFRADNAIALALKQLNEAPKPPRQIEASISAALESAILQCLEKEPSQRFQSIAELEKVLRSQAGSPPELSATLAGVPSIRTTGRASSTLQASSPHSSPARPVSKRVWVVVALILFGAFAALAARMALRGLATRHVSELSSLPAKEPAPVPPGASLDTKTPDTKTTAPAPAPPTIAAATPVVPPRPRKYQKHASTEAGRAAAAPADRSEPAAAPTSTPVPAETVASTEPAIPEPAPPSTPSAADGALSAGAQNGPSMIWVGRFAREVVAQNTASRIADMGLRVSVIPRHNPVTNSDFFVVTAGPFAADKIDSTVEQLRAKGFVNARPAKGKPQAEPRSAP